MPYLNAMQVRVLSAYETLLSCLTFGDATLDEVQQGFCRCLENGIDREQLEILNVERDVTL
jgi:hypothetical protein